MPNLHIGWSHAQCIYVVNQMFQMRSAVPCSTSMHDHFPQILHGISVQIMMDVAIIGHVRRQIAQINYVQVQWLLPTAVYNVINPIGKSRHSATGVGNRFRSRVTYNDHCGIAQIARKAVTDSKPQMNKHLLPRTLCPHRTLLPNCQTEQYFFQCAHLRPKLRSHSLYHHFRLSRLLEWNSYRCDQQIERGSAHWRDDLRENVAGCSTSTEQTEDDFSELPLDKLGIDKDMVHWLIKSIFASAALLYSNCNLLCILAARPAAWRLSCLRRKQNKISAISIVNQSSISQ